MECLQQAAPEAYTSGAAFDRMFISIYKIVWYNNNKKCKGEKNGQAYRHVDIE
jgi:hypothetical protein